MTPHPRHRGTRTYVRPPVSEGSVPLITRLRTASLLTPRISAASLIVTRRVANPVTPQVAFSYTSRHTPRGSRAGPLSAILVALRGPSMLGQAYIVTSG